MAQDLPLSMNHPLISLLSLSLAFSATAQEPRKQGIGPSVLPEGPLVPSKDLAGDEELAARRAASGATGVKAVPKKARGFTLESLSQFVNQGDLSAILPKGSVIHCPDALAIHLVAKPTGTLMAWPDFLVTHRAWITTHEVTPAQIKGDVPLSEAELSSFRQGGKMVVATLRGNPVTVLPPAPKTD